MHTNRPSVAIMTSIQTDCFCHHPTLMYIIFPKHLQELLKRKSFFQVEVKFDQIFVFLPIKFASFMDYKSLQEICIIHSLVLKEGFLFQCVMLFWFSSRSLSNLWLDFVNRFILFRIITTYYSRICNAIVSPSYITVGAIISLLIVFIPTLRYRMMQFLVEYYDAYLDFTSEFRQ